MPPVCGAVAEISLSAAERNYHALRQRTRGRFCCVVKADAYGHGAERLGRLYAALGADCLAVATYAEAAALRERGLSTPILLLGHAPPEIAESAVRDEITCTAYDYAQAAALAAAIRSGRLSVHLKIDTGMGRLGFLPCEAVDAARAIDTMPHLRLEGIYTHLARADEGAGGESVTAYQLRTFGAVAEAVESALGRRLLKHAANSAGLLGYPDSEYDMVRCGLALYGYAPAAYAKETPLTPLLTLRAPLVSVKRLPSDTPLGYGGTYVTRRPSIIGVLPVGYADGIPRRAGEAGCAVLVGGAPAPVVGRVCMDQTLVDLTDCGGAIGDIASLYGARGACSLTDWAKRLGAIPYELLTAIGARIKRVYY